MNISRIDEDSVVLLATDSYRIFSDMFRLQEISRPIVQFINSLLIKKYKLISHFIKTYSIKKHWLFKGDQIC